MMMVRKGEKRLHNKKYIKLENFHHLLPYNPILLLHIRYECHTYILLNG